MGVNRHPGDTKGDSQNHIRCFAPHPGKGYQLFECFGHMAIVFFNDNLGASDNVFCLVTEKTGRLNQLFHLSKVGCCHCLHGWKTLKQAGNDQIYPGIGALGR